jgi:hypothetical protein
MRNGNIKLKPTEKATLFALYKICGGSLKCHVPMEAIQSKFKKHERHVPKKAISFLLRLGLVNRHPTKGGITFELTKDGKEYVERFLI